MHMHEYLKKLLITSLLSHPLWPSQLVIKSETHYTQKESRKEESYVCITYITPETTTLGPNMGKIWNAYDSKQTVTTLFAERF